MLKHKIKEISSPATHDRRSFITVGEVTKSNEKNNECEVTYIDKDGNKSNRKGVSLFCHDEKILSWFPSTGDKVYLQIYENTIFILGPYHKNHQLKSAQQELKPQVLSNYAFSDEGNIL